MDSHIMNPDHDPLAGKLRALRDTLSAGLVERDEPVRLALLAALAGEHLLLLGPPGTAKSLIARRLQLAFSDSTYFERLLTRFTVPEELFGPLSIKGLEQDRYERLIKAYLPAASIAFLDEIFKANSAILNALLTLLNEREFDNGTQRVSTPLIAVVGASNELPEAGELDALFDRFLLRLHVGPVTADAFPELLGLRGNDSPTVSDTLKLTMAELKTVQELAEDETPADVIALLCDLRDWCAAEGIQVSDRRWRKVAKLLRVAALTNGRDRVSVWDGWLLQHCIWNRPEDRAKVYGWYADRVGASAAMDPSRLTRIVTIWEGKLKADREGQQQMRDDQGRLLYKGPNGPTPELRVQKRRDKKEPLFLAPPESYVQTYGYGSLRRLEERTNGGEGYTREELNPLQVSSAASSGRVRFEHWPKRDAYLAEQSNWLMDGELPAAMEPTRHKDVHVDTCLREIDGLRAEVEAYRARLLTHLASLDEEIRTHLWVPADFVEPASASLRGTREEVETLLGRIRTLHEGFDLLPREDALPISHAEKDVAPVPVAAARSRGRGRGK
jgi:MoxR-like ATPase